jgi:hypothetical protein
MQALARSDGTLCAPASLRCYGVFCGFFNRSLPRTSPLPIANRVAERRFAVSSKRTLAEAGGRTAPGPDRSIIGTRVGNGLAVGRIWPTLRMPETPEGAWSPHTKSCILKYPQGVSCAFIWAQ